MTDTNWSLLNLVTSLLANSDKASPDTPNNELLYSLFGGSELTPCRFRPEELCEIRYKYNVHVWRAFPGHYFYYFRDTIGHFTPLAYLRINEHIGHGPSSYLDRVTHSYFFDSCQVERFAMFLEGIQTIPKAQPRAEEITEVAIELANTIINDLE